VWQAPGFGEYGVYLFFAISGILICTRILEEEAAVGRFRLGSFYTRRLFRIQPAAVTYLAVVGLLTLAGCIHERWPILAPCHLAATRDFGPASMEIHCIPGVCDGQLLFDGEAADPCRPSPGATGFAGHGDLEPGPTEAPPIPVLPAPTTWSRAAEAAECLNVSAAAPAATLGEVALTAVSGGSNRQPSACLISSFAS
jgi:hypothetical protein